MKFIPTVFDGSYVIYLPPNKDDRGWFVRTYCKNEFQKIGFAKEWVQMNHSYTASKGTLRGLHYQLPPYREIKLVRCIRGSIYDVIVDLRKDSPTFLQWAGYELTGEEMNMLYIPEGFAHGFQTLSDDCELFYMHSEFYRPGVEGGVRYDDSSINIKWPLPITKISERDLSHPFLNETFKGI